MSERKKRLLFQLGFVAVACLVMELALRFMGYQPGDIRPGWLWFNPVDSLYTINDFYTNHKGLLVADSGYWAKENLYINQDGFRGKEISQLDTAKKKILFIGDSFTWGMSASNFYDSSMCDLLAKNTPYEIINTGIPAADPAQYAQVAKLYIPQIKPDFVFVLFFMGNDLMKQEREIMPDKGFYYWTNAGAILTDYDGKHFDNVQDAYNYAVNERYFLKQPHHWYEHIINKSALLSRLYSLKYRIREKIEYEELTKHPDITLKHLQQIVSIADSNAVPVKIVLIPEAKEADMELTKYKEKYNALLNAPGINNTWLYPAPGKQYFRLNRDGHLNNEGHIYYYQYLKQQLDNYFVRQ